MRETEGAEHGFLVHLFGGAFDHVDRVGSASHAQVEQAIRHLRDGGVHDQFAVDQADAHAADGTAPRDVRDHDSGAGGNNAEHVDLVFLVMAERGEDNLHLVTHVVREQGAQRAVDDAGIQNRLFGRTPFTAEEAAGNTPRRVELLFKIDAQGEKVDAFASVLAHGRCGKHHCLPQLHRDRAARLFRQLAGFDDNFIVAEPGGKAVVLTHKTYHVSLLYLPITRHARYSGTRKCC